MPITRREFLVSSSAIVSSSLVGGTAPAVGTMSAPRWKLPESRPFSVVENEWIPMKDGIRLAVRLWIPDGARKIPVPVVMEYIPYRKRDGTREGDDPHGKYLAEHGIAFARVEIRGSGDSQGLLRGEYTSDELAEGAAAIAWLAKQPWSNGSVGMRGYSWGGFNSLQIACLAPPELKAIMPMCFTDNRYTDDAHYVGGALGLVNYEWGTLFQVVLTGPPDPEIFGESWKEEWLTRLKTMPPVLAEWLTHQRFDAYWQRASVGLDYGRVKCPVYCVGGWEDGYNNSIARALTELKVPRKGLIGPWAHNNPNNAEPGPGLEWVYEEVRWWQQWLNGMETGIMDEPMLRFYMPDRKASEVYPQDTPGRWVAEDVWPSPRVQPAVYYLNSGALSSTAGESRRIDYKADRIVGLQRMEWLPSNMRNDLAREQTPDDRGSVLFDSQPLAADLEIVGNPLLKIRVSADVPVAKVAARLTEVTPDGQSWLVTYGLLNLTHRDGHEHPTALAPGAFYDVNLSLNLVAHRFKKGSAIRVAISESLWPLVWPSPQPVTLAIMTGVSSLALPVRPPRQPEPEFTIPEIRNLSSPGQGEKRVETTATGPAVHVSGPDASGRVVIEKTWPDASTTIKEIGTTVGVGWRNWRMETVQWHPNAGLWKGDCVRHIDRPGWGQCSLAGSYELTSSPQVFHLKETIVAIYNEKILFERTWNHDIARDLM